MVSNGGGDCDCLRQGVLGLAIGASINLQVSKILKSNYVLPRPGRKRIAPKDGGKNFVGLIRSALKAIKPDER